MGTVNSTLGVAVPGERNQPNWEAMQAGDYVLVYQVKHYTYWTRVISKHWNAAFAEALWGKDPEGRTWEFMYFLQPPSRCNVQFKNCGCALSPWGFSRTPADRVQSTVSQYGSIEKFIEARLEGSETYLLLRSNEKSGWSDREGIVHFHNQAGSGDEASRQSHRDALL